MQKFHKKTHWKIVFTNDSYKSITNLNEKIWNTSVRDEVTIMILDL